ncbi:zona pellucida sperm-binding protein 1-like isoform X3 [Gymnodraco acuticeps]|uniref:Zona pellucida sperm-binding protein 4 n=1 Tax=Gymnodraco acuticeps TaxID=8218 RepID=A0A6P8U5R7_GYMAC|nr:zona pellucida sperm-binding protein 1-like isoform X3 [Gymnodraco acuticeps]
MISILNSQRGLSCLSCPSSQQLPLNGTHLSIQQPPLNGTHLSIQQLPLNGTHLSIQQPPLNGTHLRSLSSPCSMISILNSHSGISSLTSLIGQQLPLYGTHISSLIGQQLPLYGTHISSLIGQQLPLYGTHISILISQQLPLYGTHISILISQQLPLYGTHISILSSPCSMISILNSHSGISSLISQQLPLYGTHLSIQQPPLNGTHLSIQQPPLNGTHISIQQPPLNGTHISILSSPCIMISILNSHSGISSLISQQLPLYGTHLSIQQPPLNGTHLSIQQPPPKWNPHQHPTTPPKWNPHQKPQKSLQHDQQPQQPQQSQQPPQPKQPPWHQKPHQPQQSQQTCEVADNQKISCGAPGISTEHCEAINCCYGGNMCYYGKSVTLQCTKDGQFIVVVAKDATLPYLDLETVFFLGGGETCHSVGTTSAFAIYQFPVTACGTVMMEEPGVIIYENRMSSSYEVAIGPNGAITRDSQYELLVQCRYIGTAIEALVIEVGILPPPLPVAAPGPLRVELVLANGECSVKGCVEEDVAYNSFYVDSDYPVTKVLRDPVYVEVHILERTDPNIKLTLGKCWATSDPYPQSLPQWDLLIDGCPYRDDRYLTTLVPVDASSGLMYPTHHRRFVFKMFTFVSGGGVKQQALIPLNEKVYIHCEAAVCQPSVGDNCEPRCFRSRRDVSVQKASREETTVVSSKELVFIQ